jgi:hypothetical protein
LNPLAGLPGANFVTNGIELAEQLKTPSLTEIDKDFFCLDEDLNRWKGLLKE